MFKIDNLQNYIDDALKSWHGSLVDPLNPAMKFFGENGELVDYLAKCMFKPNFKVDEEHVIAEAGDAWYYWRILAKIHNLTPQFYNDNFEEVESVSVNAPLALMGASSAAIYASICANEVDDLVENSENVNMFLVMWIDAYVKWLEESGFEFDMIHEYNVKKLGGPTNHGWNPEVK